MQNKIKEIASQYVARRISEKDAVSRIARIKSCNLGYAKHLLEEIISDTSNLSEGSVRIASELDKPFNTNGDLNTWAQTYVPQDGSPALTKGGELVRASRVIITEYLTNGHEIGKGQGKILTNAAARYIASSLPKWNQSRMLRKMLKSDLDGEYIDWLNDFESDMTDFLVTHEDLFHEENPSDFMDYFDEEEDSYEPITDIVVYVGGNDYGFSSKDGDTWDCEYANYSDESCKLGNILTDTEVEDRGMVIDRMTDDPFSTSADDYEYTLIPVDYRDDNEDELHHSWEVTSVEPQHGIPVDVGGSTDLETIFNYGDEVVDIDGKPMTFSSVRRSW